MKRKKKYLVEDIAPTDLGRGRTIGKLDMAVSRPNESRKRIFTNTAVPRFDGTRCCEQTRQPYSWWHTWTERHFKWPC